MRGRRPSTPASRAPSLARSPAWTARSERASLVRAGSCLPIRPQFCPVMAHEATNAGLLLGPDPTAASEPVIQSPVADRLHTKTMPRHAGFPEEILNFAEKIVCHGGHICTHPRARRCTTKCSRRRTHSRVRPHRMSKWFERLITVIESDDRSKRQLSADAGLGPNYVSQMLNRKSDQQVDKVMRLIETLGPESALWILTGTKMSAADVEMFRLASSLDDDLKVEALRFFRLMQARSGTKGPPPDLPGLDSEK